MHQNVVVVLLIQVLHWKPVQDRLLELLTCIERAVDNSARLQVFQLGPDHRAALAGLVVLEPYDGPYIVVEYNRKAVFEIAGIDSWHVHNLLLAARSPAGSFFSSNLGAFLTRHYSIISRAAQRRDRRPYRL